MVASGDLERVELERAEPVDARASTLGSPGGRARGGASRWRRTRNRRATAAEISRGQGADDDAGEAGSAEVEARIGVTGGW